MSRPRTLRGDDRTSKPRAPRSDERTSKAPCLVFDHLDAMTDNHGLFEHAEFAVPRPEHGYCLDDVARALVVTCTERRPTALVVRLRGLYLEFVLSAMDVDGRFHNRMNADGEWTDEPGLGDWWGRGVWALGVAAARLDFTTGRARALAAFRVAAQQRSPENRAMAFASLGAGEVLDAWASEPAARNLLRDAIVTIDRPRLDRHWPWPEPRLRYANAAIAEALMTAGDRLGDNATRARGLELLRFLLRLETRDGHLSVAPVGGRGRDDFGPGFDQQPIEVAAMASACGTAYQITADPHWLTGISMAWRWFLGDNDSATQMFDPVTGAGFDGLHSDGRNLNQGAESTLAMLATAQRVRTIQELR